MPQITARSSEFTAAYIKKLTCKIIATSCMSTTGELLVIFIFIFICCWWNICTQRGSLSMFSGAVASKHEHAMLVKKEPSIVQAMKSPKMASLSSLHAFSPPPDDWYTRTIWSHHAAPLRIALIFSTSMSLILVGSTDILIVYVFLAITKPYF